MDYNKLTAINDYLTQISHPYKQGGKVYVEVAKRIQGFWQLYPNGRIVTGWHELTDDHAICIANVYDGDVLLSTGTAREDRGASFVNKTSYIENAETSAVGRALGILGIGSVDAVSSYDEVTQAQTAQSKPKAQATKEMNKPNKTTVRREFVNICQYYGLNPKDMALSFNLSNSSTDAEFAAAIEGVKNMMTGG